MPAPTSRRIMGSRTISHTVARKFCGLAVGSSFNPSAFSLAAASDSVSPLRLAELSCIEWAIYAKLTKTVASARYRAPPPLILADDFGGAACDSWNRPIGNDRAHLSALPLR